MAELIITASLAAGQQPNPVIDAVHKGHAVGHEQDGVEAVRDALKAGGNVNERDAPGWTPLMWAALECRARIVKLLLDSGANPNLRAHQDMSGSFLNSGQTALIVAAGCFIARRRAELAPERHMPSDYVAYELSSPAVMVRDLLAHQASVNDADVNGRTPLMMACMHSWPNVVAELLNAHAPVNARDKEGRLAIDYADPKDTESLALLRKAGSERPSGSSGRRVCDAERALNMPIIDCIADHDFSAAVRKFQRQHGLPETGELDAVTRAQLGIR